MMRRCSKCQTEKEISDFYKCSARKDGYSVWCKSCSNQSVVSWIKRNPKKANFGRDKWAKENPDKVKAHKRKWAKANRGKLNAYDAARCASKRKQTPKWANKSKIKELYVLANTLNMHVDHIIPLNGELVSGLHVFENLQLLTAVENIRKSNNFIVE